ncbi:hypothetical protein [Catellatospora sp. NPDC049133]|uniref:hypothetical protein n=1 Tax=Catellatospora sp. NPDC049133 TaxID=3155499 RepID=UPI003411AF16
MNSLRVTGEADVVAGAGRTGDRGGRQAFAREAPTMIEFVLTLLLLACAIVAGLALMGPAGHR